MLFGCGVGGGPPRAPPPPISAPKKRGTFFKFQNFDLKVVGNGRLPGNLPYARFVGSSFDKGRICPYIVYIPKISSN